MPLVSALVSGESFRVVPQTSARDQLFSEARLSLLAKRRAAFLGFRGPVIESQRLHSHTGDTPDVFGDVLQFVRESGLYEVQITFMTPFPGTPLYERMRKEGRLLRDNAWELCTLFDVNMKPTGMSVAELESGLLWLAGKIYSEDFTRERREKFFEQRRGQIRSKSATTEAQT